MNHGPGNCRMLTRLICNSLLLLSLALPVLAEAQQQPGNSGVPVLTPVVPAYTPWHMPQPMYPYQQQMPATMPGYFNPPRPGQQPTASTNPWAYPSAPAAAAYQPQQASRVQVSRPYVEARVDSSSAYVHQNLVMTIEVISRVNLKTVAVELQETDAVIFRQLGDATASTRTRQGQREIVNTLYYQLTPLRSGNIELEPVRVSGIMDAGPAGQAYDANAGDGLSLSVSAPIAGLQPWLPLHELVLSASLSNDERIGEGEPITLTVVQRAVGMSGTQLPSLEDQLQAPGHRLYREKSDYDGSVTRQGELVGTRTDRYTLVPLQGNEVDIPAIRVDWWNVDRQRRETAVLPSRLLNERNRRQGLDGQSVAAEAGRSGAYWILWLSSLAAAFVLGRFWLRLSPGLQRIRRWFWRRLENASQPMLRQLAVLLARLSPQRNLHRLRRHIADSLPRSARLWFCVRSADDEQDPDDWSQVLRFLINRRLGLSAQLPMSKLAEHIIEIHPGADARRIRSLLSELEAALFAGRPIADFDNWKKEFKFQIRPRFYAVLTRNQRGLSGSGLPDLNPGVG